MRKREPGGHHSDYSAGHGIEQHFFAKDVGVAAELRLPERVTDDGDVLKPGRSSSG